MTSVLSHKTRFLHSVNVNYKYRFQGLKASVSRTLFYFINLHVDRLAVIQSLHDFIGMHTLFTSFAFLFMVIVCSRLRLKFSRMVFTEI